MGVSSIQIDDQVQLRKALDEEKLTELENSIERHGLMNALTVREGEDGGFHLVAGFRRLQALKNLGRATAPFT